MPVTSTAPEQRSRSAGQATYGMSNLRPEKTGLDFIVFVSQRDDAQHGSRIKWSPAPKVQSDKMGSYALMPFGHRAGPKLSPKEERLLEDWVKLNYETLQGYWDGDIPYTEDMLGLIKAI